MLDTYGQRVDQVYRILGDHTFERRLKSYDPRLKLMFDQRRERWVILEWAYDNSGWNVLLVSEDKDKKPIPLGEWVFFTLHAWRREYERKRDMGANDWFARLKAQAEEDKRTELAKASEDNRDLIKDEIVMWKKASREIQNLPTSDITAGYRKV